MLGPTFAGADDELGDGEEGDPVWFLEMFKDW